MVLSEGMTVYRLWRNKLLLLLGILYLCASCDKNNKPENDTLPFYNTADFDAEWIEEGDERYSTIHTVDTFTLKDQQGRFITKDSLDGNIYVANFFFTTCPGICPKMVNNLQALQTRFKDNKDIKLVSFSVMPWIDSVEVLKEYSLRNNIDSSKWYLLTGNKEQIYHLGRKSYYVEKGLGLQKKDTEFLHTESMLLIDRKGRIRGIYNATQKVDLERVSDDILTLIKE